MLMEPLVHVHSLPFAAYQFGPIGATAQHLCAVPHGA